jgi:O-antigen/teichoic acid export membrane protein
VTVPEDAARHTREADVPLPAGPETLDVADQCTASPAASSVRVRWDRLTAVLREPMHRTGNALIANSAVTALLGVVFWAAAAPRYSQADVGLNSSAISAMMMLAGFSQLNLMSAMVRFLPTSGRGALRLVTTSYLVAATLAAVVATIFVLGVRLWSPALAGFLANRPVAVWFVAATAMWCVFVLQDSVMTGLGRPVYVPVENTVHSVAKLALVVLLAAVSPRHGVFMSWTLAVLVASIPVNLLLYLRVLPHHARQARPGDAVPPLRTLARFTVGDYATAACWIAATTVPIQLVLRAQGAASTASFSIAWVIASSLYALPGAVGQGLVVQGAREPERLSALRVKAFTHTYQVLVPVTVVTIVGAPLILRIFGEAYAVQGSTTLRLLAVAALPFAVVSLTVSELRVQRRVLVAFLVMFAAVGLVLGLTLVFLPSLGIAGVGVAWIVGQSVVAAVILVWRRLPAGPNRHGSAPAPVA